MIIEEFKEKHLEDAAKLFQQNYLELKSDLLYLPDKYENLDIIYSNLKKIISESPSFVAISSSKVVGYYTAYWNIKELKGSLSGTYCPEWGHSAVFDDREKIYENLYTEISKCWIDNKDYTHIISFLSNTRLGNTFSMLGFGYLLIDAVRNLAPLNIGISSEFSFELADKSHISQLRELDDLMNQHLESSPIYLKRDCKLLSDQKIREEFLNDNIITLLARKNGEVVSCIRGKKNHGNIPIIDEKGTFGVNFGYTKKEYRRSGVSSILLDEIIKIAKNNGATFCSVDFETQNIQGRKFWLKHFYPIVYSMMRKVEDRLIQL